MRTQSPLKYPVREVDMVTMEQVWRVLYSWRGVRGRQCGITMMLLYTIILTAIGLSCAELQVKAKLN